MILSFSVYVQWTFLVFHRLIHHRRLSEEDQQADQAWADPTSLQHNCIIYYNFVIDVFLDKEVPTKFWKSSGSDPNRTPDPDWSCLGGGLGSPSALVSLVQSSVIEKPPS